jgi:hypothetical protein
MTVMEATILPIFQQNIFGQEENCQNLGLPAEGFDIILAEKSLHERENYIRGDTESEKTYVSPFISSLGQILFVEPIIISSDAFNRLSDSVQNGPESSSPPIDSLTKDFLSDAFDVLKDNLQSTFENSIYPVDPIIQALAENSLHGDITKSSNSSLSEGLVIREDMPLPLAMIPQGKLFPPIQQPDHPEIFILRDNLNVSSENPINLFSTEEPPILLKVLSAMNTARDDSQNGYNIERTLIVGPENMKAKPTDCSLSNQASISLKQTLTPLETMVRLRGQSHFDAAKARSSAVPLLAGLDFEKNPVEFNAPPVESLWVERPKFLTGFTDPSVNETISQAEKQKVFELKEVVLSFHPPKGQPDNTQHKGYPFLYVEEKKTGPSLNSEKEEVLVLDSVVKDLGKAGKIIWEEDEMVTLSENKDQNQNRLVFSDPNGSQKIISPAPEEVKSGRGGSLVKTDPLEIYQQISRQIIWSLKNNGEKIKLALDPPQLGSLFMEINREKDNIKATIWTDNLVTKEILEIHQVQLYKILREEGFKLEKFEVLFNQDMGLLQQREENPVDHRQRAQDRFEEGTHSPSSGQLETTQMATDFLYRGNQYIDLFI